MKKLGIYGINSDANSATYERQKFIELHNKLEEVVEILDKLSIEKTDFWAFKQQLDTFYIPEAYGKIRECDKVLFNINFQETLKQKYRKAKKTKEV